MWPKLRRVLEIEAFVLLIVCFLGALLFDYRMEKRFALRLMKFLVSAEEVDILG